MNYENEILIEEDVYRLGDDYVISLRKSYDDNPTTDESVYTYYEENMSFLTEHEKASFFDEFNDLFLYLEVHCYWVKVIVLMFYYMCMIALAVALLYYYGICDRGFEDEREYDEEDSDEDSDEDEEEQIKINILKDSPQGNLKQKLLQK